jgi:hypothetical protein
MRTQRPGGFTVAINEKERATLLRLLEQSLAEIRAEERFAETPGRGQQCQSQESIVQSLAQKVRQLQP